MERWKPTVAQSGYEQRLLKLAGKSRKLFVFLREHRHELFDDAFQTELEEMYRQTGQGQLPRPPAMMCMGLLLQAYLQTSDAEAVRLSATPANRPEEEATAALQEDMARQELFPDVLLIDRAYLNSALTQDVVASGGEIVCRPWRGAGAKPGL